MLPWKLWLSRLRVPKLELGNPRNQAKDLVEINFPDFLASTFVGATLVVQGE
jgi:hypothetical protein